MIKEFEKQIILTAKTNELLGEIKSYTKEIQKANEDNLSKIKPQIECDIQEIIDYCIKMGIPKNKTGWIKPSEKILLREDGDNSICFEIIYDTKTCIYEWYIGRHSSGIGYTICNGLFCVSYSFSNCKPKWNYGFVGHNDTESETVQYICANWKELKSKIIEEICARISKNNERIIQEANKELEKRVGDLISSNKELDTQ